MKWSDEARESAFSFFHVRVILDGLFVLPLAFVVSITPNIATALTELGFLWELLVVTMHG